ncbi:helix-turn-helix transcriptional regulator [Gymnodinialimonas sp.]
MEHLGTQDAAAVEHYSTDAAIQNTDPLLSARDGAKYFAFSLPTLWRRVADGTIPQPMKIGGMSRWRKSDFDAVIAKANADREAA